MHEFGILTGRRQTFEVPGFPGTPKLDGDGNPVLDENQQPIIEGKTEASSVDVLVFYDQNDVEWHTAFRAQPAFDYYLALDDKNRVISMEEDPEHSQVGGLRIIGISREEAAGFTRGPGGTAYGKQWLGTALGDPVLSQSEYPELSPRQLWLAAASINISKQDVLHAVAQLPDQSHAIDLNIELTEAISFHRSQPAIDELATIFDIPADQLDALWLWAAGL